MECRPLNIIVQAETDQITSLTEYFDFIEVKYDRVNLYDSSIDEFGRFTLDWHQCKPPDTLLIIEPKTLQLLMSWDRGKKELGDFLMSGNQIWCFANCDPLCHWLDQQHQALVLGIDNHCWSKNLSLFVDGVPSDRNALANFKNIKIKMVPRSWDNRKFPRITNGRTHKKGCAKDYLLLMGKKKYHRNILWKQLCKDPVLFNQGIVKYGTRTTWIGHKQSPHGGVPAGAPSMDLYLNSWIEIVPETLYNGGYYWTEKTSKPIATGTPFLMVSNAFYLRYLKSLGYKTFGYLIDESYDQCFRVEDRVNRVVSTLKDIIAQGSDQFYMACQDILEHNQQRLFEHTGSSQFALDKFFADCLQEVSSKSQC